MGDLPRRKKLRWEGYDYSSCGAYFLTICVQNRHPLLSVGAICDRPPQEFQLTNVGECICEELTKLNTVYENIAVDRFCIMPDHVHLILLIFPSKEIPKPDIQSEREDGRSQIAPTGADEIPSVSRIVKQFKGSVTRRLGFSIWQKLFHDRVIRDRQEYLAYCRYMEINPIKHGQKL